MIGQQGLEKVRTIMAETALGRGQTRLKRDSRLNGSPLRNCWYWINDTDIESKRIFTILTILFSLAETGQSAAGPVLTVPSR